MTVKMNQTSEVLRKKIIEISYLSKAHHIGSAMSCIDVLVALYFNIMNIDPKNPNKKNRDYFIMSKGHAVLALYVTLMQRGFFSEKFLKKNFITNNGKLGGHPDRNLKLGIEISSGSLGYGISVGSGIALSKKKDSVNNKVYVLLGDGELNEGMIWEAALFASHNKLNNLVCYVDCNKLQGFGSTKNILKIEPLAKKFKSFGWNVATIDGHNINNIVTTSKDIIKKSKKPSLIILKTIKGKSIKSMEGKFESHYTVLDKKSYIEIMNKYK